MFLIENTFTIPIDNRMLGKTLYFKTIPVNEYGIQSPIEMRKAYSVTVNANGARPLPVYGLHLSGKSANVTATLDKTVTFAWTKRTREGYGGFFEAGSEPRGFGQDVTEPDFLNFKLRSMDAAGVVGRTVETSSESYTYTEEMNTSDFGTFKETLIVEVTAQGQIGNADAATKTFNLNATDGSTSAPQSSRPQSTLSHIEFGSTMVDTPDNLTPGNYVFNLTDPSIPTGLIKMQEGSEFALIDTPSGWRDRDVFDYT